jgi:hypothetical protein
MQSLKTTQQTNDAIIREVLVEQLKNEYAKNPEYRVISELGLWHGASRIDVAVVNGILHGFEIKSDRDTLNRLPEQREVYNSIFDKVTLVVGAKHFVDAFKIVPEWWGIETAHLNDEGSVFFNTIREPRENLKQDDISIARLLWRSEALELLESIGRADGVRSKPRDVIYTRIAESIEIDVLKKYVRNVLQGSRQGWRSDAQLV